MKVLLIYPQFPQSFWSYDRFMEIAGFKAVIPPLGIITVAALLPQDWEMRFRDRNVACETQADWSRGCPFNCEFCDIISLYGRKPRTKEPSQALGELQTLYDLGWRGSLFIVDDNFIGNQKNVKSFLRELIPWMEQHNHPFTFITEASVNLAEDDELLQLMGKAGFYAVFLGIETPDQDRLKFTRKQQNTRSPLSEACRKINQAGLLIYAGFILGFDGEKAGAGDRIQAFIEETSIPQPMLGILQALPNTALWDRLKQEKRLMAGNGHPTGDQNTLMNFIPTRP
ncbi:B12-binding domain-containing radical SAM protein, partial [Planktothrix agardhii 1033]|nr:B12-binding domain-containing radical SAM protein [Planktothrix agardhii 1033]